MDVLAGVFGYPRDQAIELMREVHTTGMTEVARLSLEDALTAVDRVHSIGAAAGAPLMASISPEHPLEGTYVASIPADAMS